MKFSNGPGIQPCAKCGRLIKRNHALYDDAWRSYHRECATPIPDPHAACRAELAQAKAALTVAREALERIVTFAHCDKYKLIQNVAGMATAALAAMEEVKP